MIQQSHYILKNCKQGLKEILAYPPIHNRSHGQKSLMGYSPWSHKRIRHGLATKQQYIHTTKYCCCCCFCSVSQSCLTLCDPMDCSTPGFSILHYLPEFAQTHVHLVAVPSNHLILCYLLLLPSIFPNIIQP